MRILMIGNKCGKQEAEESKGFRQAIAEVLGQGIPVIVGVNGANFAALMAWADRALASWIDPAACVWPSGQAKEIMGQNESSRVRPCH